MRFRPKPVPTKKIHSLPSFLSDAFTELNHCNQFSQRKLPAERFEPTRKKFIVFASLGTTIINTLNHEKRASPDFFLLFLTRWVQITLTDFFEKIYFHSFHQFIES
jgi:hypothetical protein